MRPRLVITSPGKRCGKTRLLDVITGTCHEPLASANASVAAVFRSLGADHPPTLIIDEADTLFGNKKAAEQNEELRALLNAGHQRGRPALRCVGPMQTPTQFPTFAMVAIAGIGEMPDTIVDRGVNITQRRRADGERVAQFRSRRDGPRLAELREQLQTWAAASMEDLRAAEPEMPVEDRAADTWEPLVAVADYAGGHWPDTARAACTALVAAASAADDDRSLSTKLLADIHETFNQLHASFLSTEDLLNALRTFDESPWSEFDLNASKLAYRLRPFDIKPGRDTTGRVRGYRLEAFTDAFRRYLRQMPSDLSESTNNQQIRFDAAQPSDGSTRQTISTRQDKTAGEAPFLTDLTTSDELPPRNGHNSPRCAVCNRPLLKTNDTDLCAECRLIARNQQTDVQATA